MTRRTLTDLVNEGVDTDKLSYTNLYECTAFITRCNQDGCPGDTCTLCKSKISIKEKSLTSTRQADSEVIPPVTPPPTEEG